MTLEAGLTAAIIGLLGTVIVEILRYRQTAHKGDDDRQAQLEDSQRELITLLQAELRATRAELADRDLVIADCKREVIVMLEQLAGRVRGTVDQIERKLSQQQGDNPGG